MNEKFTPGPWSVTVGSLIRVNVRGTGVIICGVHKIGARSAGFHQDRTVATACLIAAAPELLAALVEIEPILDSFRVHQSPVSGLHDTVRRVRAAIAKATAVVGTPACQPRGK